MSGQSAFRFMAKADDGVPAHEPHNIESYRAAIQAAPRIARRQRQIRDALDAHEFTVPAGLTADGICAWLGLPSNIVWPRLLELEKKHLVQRSEERRKTRNGSLAVIWRVVVP